MPREAGVRHVRLPHALRTLRHYVGDEIGCSVPTQAPA